LTYTVNTPDTIKDIFDLLDSEKKTLIENSNIGEILDLDIGGKHLWLVTTSLFSNYLLGYGRYDPQSIQQRYNNIFEIKETTIFDKELLLLTPPKKNRKHIITNLPEYLTKFKY
jgi:hypothetical protein